MLLIIQSHIGKMLFRGEWGGGGPGAVLAKLLVEAKQVHRRQTGGWLRGTGLRSGIRRVEGAGGLGRGAGGGVAVEDAFHDGERTKKQEKDHDGTTLVKLIGRRDESMSAIRSLTAK